MKNTSMILFVCMTFTFSQSFALQVNPLNSKSTAGKNFQAIRLQQLRTQQIIADQTVKTSLRHLDYTVRNIIKENPKNNVTSNNVTTPPVAPAPTVPTPTPVTIPTAKVPNTPSPQPSLGPVPTTPVAPVVLTPPTSTPTPVANLNPTNNAPNIPSTQNTGGRPNTNTPSLEDLVRQQGNSGSYSITGVSANGITDGSDIVLQHPPAGPGLIFVNGVDMYTYVPVPQPPPPPPQTNIPPTITPPQNPISVPVPPSPITTQTPTATIPTPTAALPTNVNAQQNTNTQVQVINIDPSSIKTPAPTTVTTPPTTVVTPNPKPTPTTTVTQQPAPVPTTVKVVQVQAAPVPVKINSQPATVTVVNTTGMIMPVETAVNNAVTTPQSGTSKDTGGTTGGVAPATSKRTTTPVPTIRITSPDVSNVPIAVIPIDNNLAKNPIITAITDYNAGKINTTQLTQISGLTSTSDLTTRISDLQNAINSIGNTANKEDLNVKLAAINAALRATENKIKEEEAKKSNSLVPALSTTSTGLAATAKGNSVPTGITAVVNQVANTLGITPSSASARATPATTSSAKAPVISSTVRDLATVTKDFNATIARMNDPKTPTNEKIQLAMILPLLQAELVASAAKGGANISQLTTVTASTNVATQVTNAITTTTATINRISNNQSSGSAPINNNINSNNQVAVNNLIKELQSTLDELEKNLEDTLTKSFDNLETIQNTLNESNDTMNRLRSASTGASGYQAPLFATPQNAPEEPPAAPKPPDNIAANLPRTAISGSPTEQNNSPPLYQTAQTTLVNTTTIKNNQLPAETGPVETPVPPKMSH